MILILILNLSHATKICEYDHKIPKSRTTDHLTALRGRVIEHC